MKGREGYKGEPSSGLQAGAGQQARLTAPRSPDCLSMATCPQGEESSSTEGSPGEVLREGPRRAAPNRQSCTLRLSHKGPSSRGLE